MVRDAGVPAFKENGMEHLPDDGCPVWVLRFPVKSPEGASFREGETAIEQCERYLQILKTWCSNRGHNQSATVYVRDDEWDVVGDWLYEHFTEVRGLTFLPYGGGKYRLAPFEEIDRETYLQSMSEMPQIDFDLLSSYELEDRGEGAKEYACQGGSCSL